MISFHSYSVSLNIWFQLYFKKLGDFFKCSGQRRRKEREKCGGKSLKGKEMEIEEREREKQRQNTSQHPGSLRLNLWKEKNKTEKPRQQTCIYNNNSYNINGKYMVHGRAERVSNKHLKLNISVPPPQRAQGDTIKRGTEFLRCVSVSRWCARLDWHAGRRNGSTVNRSC